MVVTGNTTLSLTMLQNVFCWGALCDKQWVKSEEKTKRLSVAGAAKGIEIFFGGVLQVSILLKKYWSVDFKSGFYSLNASDFLSEKKIWKRHHLAVKEEPVIVDGFVVDQGYMITLEIVIVLHMAVDYFGFGHVLM